MPRKLLKIQLSPTQDLSTLQRVCCFYGLFGFCQQEYIQCNILQHKSAQFFCCDDTPHSIHIAISTNSRSDND